jgi:hypothetical protein
MILIGLMPEISLLIIIFRILLDSFFISS